MMLKMHKINHVLDQVTNPHYHSAVDHCMRNHDCYWKIYILVKVIYVYEVNTVFIFYKIQS
jgi:hypothetical protein